MSSATLQKNPTRDQCDMSIDEIKGVERVSEFPRSRFNLTCQAFSIRIALKQQTCRTLGTMEPESVTHPPRGHVTQQLFLPTMGTLWMCRCHFEELPGLEAFEGKMVCVKMNCGIISVSQLAVSGFIVVSDCSP